MKQKFKHGDLCQLLYGQLVLNEDNELIDIRTDLVGKKVVVNFSFGEHKKSKQERDYRLYSVNFVDDNKSMSWIHDNQLKLIKRYETSRTNP